MEEAKKLRSNKGKTVTRRINELDFATKSGVPTAELEVKVGKLREAMEELGVAHDGVMAAVTNETETTTDEIETWYYN